MPRKVTIQDIAKAARVHKATVSRALRDDARIRPEVRARIRGLAEKLGYAPDPYLRALAKYRAHGRLAEFRGLLAWLTNFPERDGWRHGEKLAYLRGARRRARELGYDIEEFWAREPDLSLDRLARIFAARGIRGVLLPPQTVAGTRLALPLDGLAAVSFGHSLVEPALHCVHHHHYRSMQLMLDELRRLGYRRPGLAITEKISHSIDGAWAAAYLHYHYDRALPLVPPLINDLWGPRELLDWRTNTRPDVIISNLGETLDWLRQGGVGVPDECGLALTALHAGQPDCSGIDENSEVVGGAAAELLVSLVERGDTGRPKHPQNVLIEGTWMLGKGTVRVQSA